MFPLLGLDTLAQLPMSRDWQPGETLSPPSLPGGDESLLSAQEGPRPHPRVCGFPLGWGGAFRAGSPPPHPRLGPQRPFPCQACQEKRFYISLGLVPSPTE